MPILYGPWVVNSAQQNMIRLGIDYRLSEVTYGSTTTNLDLTVFIETTQQVTDTATTLAWSGSLMGTGSAAKSISVPPGVRAPVHVVRKTYTLGPKAQGITWAFTLSDVTIGSVAGYYAVATYLNTGHIISIPAKPITPPPAPASLSTVRLDDERQRLTWPKTGDAQSPAKAFRVDRFISTDGTVSTSGTDPRWSVYRAALSGSKLTLDTSGTARDQRVAYRIRSENAAGVSAWRYGGYLYTRPSAASNFKLVRSGNKVTASWTNVSTTRTGSRVYWRIKGAKTWEYTALLAKSAQNTVLTLTLGREYEFKHVTYAGTMTAETGVQSVYLFSPPRPLTGVTATRGATDRDYVIAASGPKSAENPYTTIEFARSVDGAAAEPLSSVSGTTIQSIIDRTTEANHSYQWAARGVNALGVTDWVFSETHKTSPNRATLKGVRRLGNTVYAEWENNDNGYADVIALEYRQRDPGTVSWSVWATAPGSASLPNNTTTATIIGLDSTKELEIRVATRVNNAYGSTSLTAYSEALPVVPLSRPLAPTAVHPASPQTSQLPFQFKWQYNTADGTDQSAYEVSYRTGRNDPWQIITGYTAEPVSSFLSLPVGTYQWQVRTKGFHSEWSDPSPLMTFQVMGAVNVAILEPSGPTTSADRLRLVVSAADPSGAKIIGWTATLYRNDIPVEILNGTAFQREINFTSELVDGASYVVGYMARSGTGAVSPEVTVPFAVAYVPPPAPLFSASYVEDRGAVELLVDNSYDPATTGPIPVYNAFDRSYDGGETWERFATRQPLNVALDDYTTELGQQVMFRAVAVSNLPSMAYSDPVVVDTTSDVTWIRWGNGLSESLSFRCGLSLTASYTEVVKTHVIRNRPKPVSVYDLDLESTVELDVSVPMIDMRAAQAGRIFKKLQRGNVWWRDHEGHAFMATISGVEVTPRYQYPLMKFRVTEVDGIPPFSQGIEVVAPPVDSGLRITSEPYGAYLASSTTGAFMPAGTTLTVEAPGATDYQWQVAPAVPTSASAPGNPGEWVNVVGANAQTWGGELALNHVDTTKYWWARVRVSDGVSTVFSSPVNVAPVIGG